jgi:hypothetical protein
MIGEAAARKQYTGKVVRRGVKAGNRIKEVLQRAKGLLRR